MQKTISLGQLLEVIASAGVIAGIIFLAFELRQNNLFLGAEARYNLLQNRQAVHLMVIQDDGVAELLVKAAGSDSLTATETEQLGWYYNLMLASWDYDYQQFRDGLVDESVLPARQWRRSFRDDRRFYDFWQTYKDDYTPDFVRWLDETVVE